MQYCTARNVSRCYRAGPRPFTIGRDRPCRAQTLRVTQGPLAHLMDSRQFHFYRHALVALGYAAVAALTASVSLRFGVPSSLFPAAGVAAGAVCLWGWPMAAAIFAGRLLFAWLNGGSFAQGEIELGIEAALAGAIALQALAGGMMARRWVGATDRLDAAGSVLKLLVLVGPASCWLAPAIGVPLLVEAHRAPAADFWYVFYKWWAGDSTGAMMTVPLLFAWFGRPRAVWLRRRRAVLLPLAATLLLLSTALLLINGWEKRRLAQQFETTARGHADAIDRMLDRLPGLLAMLHTASHAEPAGLEAAVHGVERLLPAGSTMGWVDDAAAIGTPLPAAAPSTDGLHRSIVMAPQGARLIAWVDPGARHHLLPGRIAYVSVPVEGLLHATAAGAASLDASLMLRGPDGAALIAGTRDGQSRPGLLYEQRLVFGEQELLYRSTARPDYAALERGLGLWAVEAVALFGCAFFVAFVLTATGRAQRVEQLVDRRTRALHDSRQRLRSLLDSASVGILYVTLDGRVQRSNPEGRRIVERSREQLSAVPLLSLIDPAQRDAIGQVLHSLAHGDLVAADRETRILRTDGSAIDVVARFTASRDANGRPLHLVVVIEDVTETKRLRAIARANEAAEAANRSRNEFLSRMSHELRTPLNAILGFTQVLLRNGEPPSAAERQAQLRHIEQAGWHLLAMIDDVLDLSRIESGRIRLDPVSVPVADAVQAAMEMLVVDAHARDVRLRLDDPASLLAVRADATRLRQILVNLISNAIKYNRPHGTVDIRLHALELEVGIEVVDSGLGMTPEQQGALFVPFNRLGRENGHIEGTGIGLVIVRELVQLMDGRIEVASTEGAGSSFLVWLPRTADAMPDAAAPDPQDPSTRPAMLAQPVRLLCIEDGEVNALLMEAIFDAASGYEVTIARTAAQGLSLAQSMRPDALLLDLGLPDMDGYEVLRRLQAQPATREIPVVVATADALAATREQVMRAGAAAFLTKPLDVESTRSVVRRLLAPGGSQSRVFEPSEFPT